MYIIVIHFLFKSAYSGSTYKDLRRNNPIPQHGAELEVSIESEITS